MTDWIIDPTNNIELKLDILKVIMPISQTNLAKYTGLDSNIPKVSIGEPQPFQFSLTAEILASFEDTKRKASYFDKQQPAALMVLGAKQEAMYGYLERSDFGESDDRLNIMTLNVSFVGTGSVIGHMREAEDSTLTGCSSAVDANASNGYVVQPNAQNDAVDFSVTQSPWALPLGNYRMYVRVKDSAQVASDLELSVYNTTDSTALVTASHVTCTAAFAWKSLDFTVASDDAGDAIRFRAMKDTATANTISVDLICVVAV